MRTEYDYDAWHRLIGIYHKDASTEDVLDSFAYTLTDGNEISRIDHADGAQEFGGHDHLIHGQNPSSATSLQVDGIKYHVPRTPQLGRKRCCAET